MIMLVAAVEMKQLFVVMIESAENWANTVFSVQKGAVD